MSYKELCELLSGDLRHLPPNLESVLSTSSEIFNVLKQNLPTIRDELTKLGPSADKAWARNRRKFPRLETLIGHIKHIESLFGEPLVWGDLDNWLRITEKNFEKRDDELRTYLSVLGLETNSPWSTVQEKLENNLRFLKLAELMFGPKFYRDLDKLTISVSKLHPKMLISLDHVKGKIIDAGNSIIDQWAKLQEMKAKGVLDRARPYWTKLGRWARVTWFAQFPDIHKHPNPGISMWLQGDRPSKQAFNTPLLNIDDLVEDDVLFQLLEVRSRNTHPKLFFFMDNRSVTHACGCGALPRMKVAGGVTFFSTTSNECSKYGIDFINKSDPFCNPGMALYYILEQKRMYDSLVKYARALETSWNFSASINPSNDRTGSDKALTVLARSARLNYTEPNCINWSYVLSLLAASLDEAQQELYQLRTDHHFWLMRMKEIPPNRTSTLLRFNFRRIDRFDALYHVLDEMDNLAQSGTNGNGSTLSTFSSDTNPFRGVISIYAAFLSVMNDVLASMHDIPWAPEKSTKLFSRAFDLMKEDSPLLRVMGVAEVMRALEGTLEEMQHVEPIPLSVRQIFSDLSVIAVCLREIEKHHSFVPALSQEYGEVLLQGEAKWNERERPWLSVVEHTLHGLGSKLNKLDLTAQGSSPLRERCQTFWNTVDKSMKHGMERSPIVDLIMGNAPIDSSPPVVWRPSPWEMQDPLCPTATKLNRSKGHVPRTQISSSRTITLFPVIEPQSRPCVIIEKKEHKKFWTDLLSEKGVETFDNWTKCLVNARVLIGETQAHFSMVSLSGAARKFELQMPDGSQGGAIIFHDLHGSSKKIKRSIARGYWAGRLEKHFEIVLNHSSDF